MQMTEKKVKPTIEEIAASFLDGDKLRNFLDFNESLKGKQLSKSATAKGTSGYMGWAIRYKGYMIGHFRAYKDSWFISYFKGVDINKCEKFISDEIKAFILENIIIVPPCKGCGGRNNRMILGKEFAKVCGCHLLRLDNPDGKVLEYAKELISINRIVVGDISASKA